MWTSISVQRLNGIGNSPSCSILRSLLQGGAFGRGVPSSTSSRILGRERRLARRASPTKAGELEWPLRLSPLDPMTFLCYAGIGVAHFVAGRYATAVAWLEKALLAHPKDVRLNRLLAPAYVFAGKQQEAEASVRKLIASHSDLTVAPGIGNRANAILDRRTGAWVFVEVNTDSIP